MIGMSVAKLHHLPNYKSHVMIGMSVAKLHHLPNYKSHIGMSVAKLHPNYKSHVVTPNSYDPVCRMMSALYIKMHLAELQEESCHLLHFHLESSLRDPAMTTEKKHHHLLLNFATH